MKTLIILIPLLFSFQSAIANCQLDFERLERMIQERAIVNEMRQLSAKDLAEMYNNEKLEGRLEVVKEILDTMKPFEKGLKGRDLLGKHEFALARAKAVKQLQELGMKLTQAQKSVDALVSKPNLLQRMVILVTTLETLIQRETKNPWVMRTAGVLVATSFFLPPGITQTYLAVKTGSLRVIPFVKNFELGGIMLLTLYGARGYRMSKNLVTHLYKTGTSEGYNKHEGKRDWEKVDAEATRLIFTAATYVTGKLGAGYNRWIGPHLRPAARHARALILDMSIFLNMHNANRMDQFVSSQVENNWFLSRSHEGNSSFDLSRIR